MVDDRCWSDADRGTVVSVLWTRALAAANAGVRLQPRPAADAPQHYWATAAAVLDALTAAGWHPPQQDRIGAALADLDHVRSGRATTHHDACWDEHIGCLAARLRRTLTGEDT